MRGAQSRTGASVVGDLGGGGAIARGIESETRAPARRRSAPRPQQSDRNRAAPPLHFGRAFFGGSAPLSGRATGAGASADLLLPGVAICGAQPVAAGRRADDRRGIGIAGIFGPAAARPQRTAYDAGARPEPVLPDRYSERSRQTAGVDEGAPVDCGPRAQKSRSPAARCSAGRGTAASLGPELI